MNGSDFIHTFLAVIVPAISAGFGAYMAIREKITAHEERFESHDSRLKSVERSAERAHERIDKLQGA